MGQESLTGDINKIFLDNNFSLWTKAFWRKYSAQRAMLAQGNLYYRNMKARDTILAAKILLQIVPSFSQQNHQIQIQNRPIN